MPAGAESKIREALEIALDHQRAGRLRAAGNIYRRILRIAPENPDALHFLGVIAHKTGRPDLAIELLERSVESDPNRVGFRLNLGNLFLKQQQIPKAITCYRAAINIEPTSASAHAHLAAALARQGKLDEANHAYARATELRPLPQFANLPQFGMPAALSQVPRLPSAVSPEAMESETRIPQAEPSLAEELGFNVEAAQRIEVAAEPQAVEGAEAAAPRIDAEEPRVAIRPEGENPHPDPPPEYRETEQEHELLGERFTPGAAIQSENGTAAQSGPEPGMESAPDLGIQPQHAVGPEPNAVPDAEPGSAAIHPGVAAEAEPTVLVFDLQPPLPTSVAFPPEHAADSVVDADPKAALTSGGQLTEPIFSSRTESVVGAETEALPTSDAETGPTSDAEPEAEPISATEPEALDEAKPEALMPEAAPTFALPLEAAADAEPEAEPISATESEAFAEAEPEALMPEAAPTFALPLEAAPDAEPEAASLSDVQPEAVPILAIQLDAAVEAGPEAVSASNVETPAWPPSATQFERRTAILESAELESDIGCATGPIFAAEHELASETESHAAAQSDVEPDDPVFPPQFDIAAEIEQEAVTTSDIELDTMPIFAIQSEVPAAVETGAVSMSGGELEAGPAFAIPPEPAVDSEPWEFSTPSDVEPEQMPISAAQPEAVEAGAQPTLLASVEPDVRPIFAAELETVFENDLAAIPSDVEPEAAADIEPEAASPSDVEIETTSLLPTELEEAFEPEPEAASPSDVELGPSLLPTELEEAVDTEPEAASPSDVELETTSLFPMELEEAVVAEPGAATPSDVELETTSLFTMELEEAVVAEPGATTPSDVELETTSLFTMDLEAAVEAEPEAATPSDIEPGSESVFATQPESPAETEPDATEVAVEPWFDGVHEPASVAAPDVPFEPETVLLPEPEPEHSVQVALPVAVAHEQYEPAVGQGMASSGNEFSVELPTESPPDPRFDPVNAGQQATSHDHDIEASADPGADPLESWQAQTKDLPEFANHGPFDFVIRVEPADDSTADMDEHRPPAMGDAALALEYAWALHAGPAHHMVSPIDDVLLDIEAAEAGLEQEDLWAVGPSHRMVSPIDGFFDIDSEQLRDDALLEPPTDSVPRATKPTPEMPIPEIVSLIAGEAEAMPEPVGNVHGRVRSFDADSPAPAPRAVFSGAAEHHPDAGRSLKDAAVEAALAAPSGVTLATDAPNAATPAATITPAMPSLPEDLPGLPPELWPEDLVLWLPEPDPIEEPKVVATPPETNQLADLVRLDAVESPNAEPAPTVEPARAVDVATGASELPLPVDETPALDEAAREDESPETSELGAAAPWDPPEADEPFEVDDLALLMESLGSSVPEGELESVENDVTEQPASVDPASSSAVEPGAGVEVVSQSDAVAQSPAGPQLLEQTLDNPEQRFDAPSDQPPDDEMLPVERVEPADLAPAADTDELDDTVDWVELSVPVEKIELVGTVEPVGTVERVKTAEPVETVEPVELFQTAMTTETAQTVNIELADQVETVGPLELVEMIEPDEPSGSSASSESAETLSPNDRRSIVPSPATAGEGRVGAYSSNGRAPTQTLPRSTHQPSAHPRSTKMVRDKHVSARHPERSEGSLPSATEETLRFAPGDGYSRQFCFQSNTEPASDKLDKGAEPIESAETSEIERVVLAEAVGLAGPIALVAPVEPDSTEPIDGVTPVEWLDSISWAAPTELAEPVEPAEPLAPVSLAEPVWSAKLIEPIAPVEPDESTEPIDLITSVESVDPISWAAPIELAEPVEPAETFRLAVPVASAGAIAWAAPIELAEPIESLDLPEQVASPEGAVLAEPVGVAGPQTAVLEYPIEPVTPAEPAELSEPTALAEPVESVELVEPVEPIERLGPTVIREPVRLVEPAEPAVLELSDDAADVGRQLVAENELPPTHPLGIPANWPSEAHAPVPTQDGDSLGTGPAAPGAEQAHGPDAASPGIEAAAPPGLLGEAHADVLAGHLDPATKAGRAIGAKSGVVDRLAETLPLPGGPAKPVSRAPAAPAGALAPRRPPSAESLRRQAVTLVSFRRLDEAIELLKRAVTLRPKFAEAHRDLGGAMLRRGDLDGAIASLRRALRLRPGFAEAWGSLGDAYQLEGKIVQAIRCYRRLLSLAPRASKVHSNMLLSMNYDAKFTAEEVFREHLLWAERHADPFSRDIPPHTNDRSPDRQLKIGYVSPDFRRHSVNYFAEPVLAGHYRKDFHVTCYSDVIRPDGVTRGLAEMCDQFRDTRPMSDEELAARIRADEIDILIDLSGHTGNNRLGTFARKPAPVQVTYLGYPNTTGLSTIDYRITDGFADPPGKTDAVHSEQLIRLPETFLCYQPPRECPDVGPLPCLKTDYVTFGCFNIMAKITDEVMALWASILQELPNSRLVLKGRSSALSHENRRKHVRSVFVNHGISADRIELLGKEPSYARHLSHYRRLDIVLDPFPYNGTTTTCEALWMGLPVVTLAGDRHVSRVGVSILSNMGLTDLIAATPQKYVQIATRLADTPRELAKLRSGLRERMLRSPLTDSIRLTRALEFAYRNMWRHWCESKPAEAAAPPAPPLDEAAKQGTELTADRVNE